VATDIFLPQLGLTMTEGTVIRWLKREGDPVEKDEPVVEIETDKVTMEVEAKAAGVMGPILVSEGGAAAIGAVLGYILEPGEEAPDQIPMVSGAAPATAIAPGEQAQPRPASQRQRGRIVASPRARRLAYERDIDLAQIEASGPGGRIVEADVRWYVDKVAAAAPRVTPTAQRMARALEVDLSEVEGTGLRGRIVKEDVERAATIGLTPETVSPAAVAPFQVEPLTGIRKVVAERMAHSFTTTPHFYLSVETDVTALTELRTRLLPGIEAAAGVRLTLTDILIRVCAQALKEFPTVNVAWVEPDSGLKDGGLLRQVEINVGLAIAIDDGLVVPVIRQANELGLGEIARRRGDLVKRARSGQLTLPDLEGGTFTLSNLGMFGIDHFQAIINSPQSAILAAGRIRERPLAINGQVVVRPTMYLTLSVDHRLLYGAEAARFLQRVSQLIEEPYLLLS